MRYTPANTKCRGVNVRKKMERLCQASYWFWQSRLWGLHGVRKRNGGTFPSEVMCASDNDNGEADLARPLSRPNPTRGKGQDKTVALI